MTDAGFQSFLVSGGNHWRDFARGRAFDERIPVMQRLRDREKIATRYRGSDIAVEHILILCLLGWFLAVVRGAVLRVKLLSVHWSVLKAIEAVPEVRSRRMRTVTRWSRARRVLGLMIRPQGPEAVAAAFDAGRQFEALAHLAGLVSYGRMSAAELNAISTLASIDHRLLDAIRNHRSALALGPKAQESLMSTLGALSGADIVCLRLSVGSGEAHRCSISQIENCAILYCSGKYNLDTVNNILKVIPNTLIHDPAANSDIRNFFKEEMFVGEAADLIDKYVGRYSEKEKELSEYTEKLTSSITEYISRMDDTYGLELVLQANSVSIDDVVFSRILPAIAIASHARHVSRVPVLYFSDIDKAAVFGALIGHFSGLSEVYLVAQQKRQVPISHMGTLLHSYTPRSKRKMAGRAVSVSQPIAEKVADQKGCGLVVGRLSDRNYGADIRAFVREASSMRKTFFVPSAIPSKERSEISNFIQREYAGIEVLGGPILAMNRPVTAFSTEKSKKYISEIIGKSEVRDFIVVRYIFDHLTRKISEILECAEELHSEVEAIFEKHEPKYVLMAPGRDAMSRHFAIEAKRRSVLTCDLQTVFVGPRSRYKETNADYQFAIESESAKIFAEYFGVPPSRIVETGCVKIGALRAQVKAIVPLAARQELGLGDGPVVFFAASPHASQCGPVLKALLAAALALKVADVVVKLHPTCKPEDEKALRAVVEQNAWAGKIHVRKDLLAECIAAADVVVTRFSNVGLEAALVGKPVVACAFGGELPPIRLDLMGVAWRADTPDDLAVALADLLAGGHISERLAKSRLSYVDRNPALLSDNPAGTILHHIERLVAAGTAGISPQSGKDEPIPHH